MRVAERLKLYGVPGGASSNQLDALIAKATADAASNSNIADSCIIIINGIQAAQAVAVSAALAAGATTAELASFTALDNTIEAATAKMASSVTAATPAANLPAAAPTGTVH